ncbi:hypothetical protein GGI19_002042 [Coemansia pectinata]|uniref:Uncharacterized protein n=1 Tax=Coemansia pectinata TaxID=1052879 RepID=A0A9W8H0G2_9FUNG|nr:hypothetical protein GGI19_002042 [Coemansia pectinata]
MAERQLITAQAATPTWACCSAGAVIGRGISIKKIEHPPLACQPVHRHLPPESQPAPTPVAELSVSDAQAKDKIRARQSVRNGKRESAKALVAAHKSNVDLSGTLAKRFNAAIELLHDHGLITLSAVAPRIPLPQCAKTFSRSLPPAVAARRLRVKVAIRESIRTRQAARDRQHTINIRAALCRLAKAKDNSPAVAEMAAQAMELDQEFQVVSARVLEYERQAAQAKQAIRDTRATRRYEIILVFGQCRKPTNGYCDCCGYECDCMDLYYDHIMFDSKHREMAQREVAKAPAPRRMNRISSAYRSRSSLLLKQPSQSATPKSSFVYGESAY